MNRVGLSIEVARQVGGSKKDAAKYIDAVLNGIVIGMERDKQVRLAKFGTFSAQLKPAHDGMNPATGETIKVPDKYFPKLKFSEDVKDYINSNN